MSLNSVAIFSAIASHAKRLGIFERVQSHEPKNEPGNGLTCAVWLESVSPFDSTLASTTALVVFSVRIYGNMIQKPEDSIDVNMLKATDLLMNEYSGDFELGGNVRCVDLLGQSGNSLNARAGYLTIGTTMYRVMTIVLPLIVNDVWDQVA